MQKLLLWCSVLNPSLFGRGETFGHDLLRLWFLLPLCTVQCTAQRCWESCRCPSAWPAQGSSTAPGFATTHLPVGVSFASNYAAAGRHIARSSLCALKAEVCTPTRCAWAVRFFACSGCFYFPSTAGPPQLYLHSPASERLNLDLELNSTVLHIFSSHLSNPYTSTATSPFGLQTVRCSQGPDKASWQETAHPRRSAEW